MIHDEFIGSFEHPEVSNNLIVLKLKKKGTFVDSKIVIKLEFESQPSKIKFLLEFEHLQKRAVMLRDEGKRIIDSKKNK